MASGCDVVGLDDLNDYYSKRLKNWRLDQIQAQAKNNFTFIQGDLGDRSLLSDLFQKHTFDAVINLAARAGVRYSIENPGLYFETNLTAFLGLLEEMVKNKVNKLVQASTSSVYAGQPSPFTEDLKVDCPLSPYAASKKSAEALAYTFHHLYDLDVSIVRYFTVYGPAGRPDMSPLKFTHCIANGIPFPLYGDGKQRRDFTYVDDIARGTIAALKPLGHEVINLGGGYEPMSILKMIQLLEQFTGNKAVIDYQPFNPADMVETSADISKANSLLGWHSMVKPEEGMKALVDWYLSERDWLAAEL